MFSGIVEKLSQIKEVSDGNESVTIQVERPSSFTDIKVGDSIAHNGVCLTVESFNDSTMQFTLGLETLKVTGWSREDLLGRPINIERSLKFGDRVHGHIVLGHVDFMATVNTVEKLGDNMILTIELPSDYRAYIWPKGSVAVNGVSLTINKVSESTFCVGLIPETLKITNLSLLKAGDLVTVEIDNNARGLIHYFKNSKQESCC